MHLSIPRYICLVARKILLVRLKTMILILSLRDIYIERWRWREKDNAKAIHGAKEKEKAKN